MERYCRRRIVLCSAVLVLVAMAGQVAGAPLIAAGSTWKYLDDGSNQGTAWYGTAFDDSGWASGPAELGYGDGDEATVVSFGDDDQNKHITTYFRQTFNVPDASLYEEITFSVKRDDGFVIYLNGSEVFRDSMPTGTITYTTTATQNLEDSYFRNWTRNASTLVNGTNVLAVEIHQYSGNNPDISFDLALTGPVTTIVRGPYLQNGTTDGVTIMWRTAASVSSKVWYGTSLGSLNQTVTDATSRTNHTIPITGLPPATKYFYQVGTADDSVLAGGNGDHYFVTSPIAGSTDPVRIWVLGDSGTANNNARAVKNAYLELADNEKEADIWLMLGDNAYNSGTDSEYQAAVFETYPEILRNKVLWSTRGNHEMSTSVYYGIFDLPTQGEGGGLASGTEHYYSFDYGNVHFICLNSQETNFSSNPSSAMYQWLEQDLADTVQDWIIAFWHHPPYTKGSHNSDNSGDSGGRMTYIRENALPILEAGGVDMVLTGHSHSYERSYFLNGHYGSSGSFDSNTHVVQTGDGREDGNGAYLKCGTDGAVYIVAGSSGKLGGGSLNHPAKLVSLNRLGSLIIDVDNSRLDSRFLRENTRPTRIDDYFTIEFETCVADNTAPTPDPMTWGSVPEGTSTDRISMTASTALDDYFDVEYYFECTAGAGNDSGWQSSSTYVNTGLAPDTQYSYRVKARDRSRNLNETGFSSTESASTHPPDLLPPRPNPTTWASHPEAGGFDSISMAVVPATDPTGVEYYFECTAGPGHDSGWRVGTTYVDTGLDPSVQYSYRVKARDTSPNLNETGFSSVESATTPLPDVLAPQPNPTEWALRPESSGIYSILMAAVPATDPSGVEYYFECTAGGGNDSRWQDSDVYEDTRLSQNTIYTYRVKARDKSPNQNETGWAYRTSARTDIRFPNPGDFNRDRKVNFQDLGLFGSQFGQNGCGPDDFWCNFTDMDLSAGVDATDLWMFSSHWLEEYLLVEFELDFDDFESYTAFTRLGDQPDWSTTEGDTTVKGANGVGGSQGLSPGSNYFVWSAGDGSINGFNWTASSGSPPDGILELADGDALVISMDFLFGVGTQGFERESVGFTIFPNIPDSIYYFSISLDDIDDIPGSNYGIEASWFTMNGTNPVTTIASIPNPTVGAWYRLRAEFSKLTETSLSIYAQVWLLDDNGNKVSLFASGSIADTSVFGNDGPHEAYCWSRDTGISLWPAFMNSQGYHGGADNAYFGIIPIE